MRDTWRERVGAVTSGYERGFSSERSLTLGLEEELILVDPDSLLPVDEIDWALAQVGEDGRFRAELRSCQIELRTPICLTVADGSRELASARAEAVRLAGERFRLAAVGTHPVA